MSTSTVHRRVWIQMIVCLPDQRSHTDAITTFRPRAELSPPTNKTHRTCRNQRERDANHESCGNSAALRNRLCKQRVDVHSGSLTCVHCVSSVVAMLQGTLRRVRFAQLAQHQGKSTVGSRGWYGATEASKRDGVTWSYVPRRYLWSSTHAVHISTGMLPSSVSCFSNLNEQNELEVNKSI